MVIEHEFRPYADFPDLCVAELAETGDTCNKHRVEHVSTKALLRQYLEYDDDRGDEALEELHRRAMAGDTLAYEILNDYDRDDPDFTPQTGSETRE